MAALPLISSMDLYFTNFKCEWLFNIYIFTFLKISYPPEKGPTKGRHSVWLYHTKSYSPARAILKP